MSAIKQNRLRFLISDCWVFGLVIALFGVVVNQAYGTDSLYENDAVVVDPSPIPDATNFLNTGSFTVSTPSSGLYQTRNTLNYTNTGYMDAPLFGYDFDTFNTDTSQHSEAASFDNENVIECAEQCIVWSTNIVNPGSIFVDDNLGLEQFTGGSVDLSHTVLTLQGGVGPGSAIPNSLDFGTGTDTNGEWVPLADLTATNATSSLFHSRLNNVGMGTTLSLPTFQSFLPPQSYFNLNVVSTNLTIIRAAFIENLNANTPYNVYFGAPANTNLGGGFITIEWQGVFTNTATGQSQTTYLYMNDLPEPILTNGEKVIAGIPNNYTFFGSSAPQIAATPTPAGFTNVFSPGNITNNYSYVEVQFIATTVPTNTLFGTNVSAIGGRVMMNAAQELNLNQAAITGPNYVNITATNQFDGTGGAAIQAPFADLSIGVTNQSLAVSNVLQPIVANWSGTIQGWTTRFLNIVTNTIISSTNGGITFTTNSFTATNDFRIELVSADVSPITPAQVQNLTLLATNSCVISDTFNMFGSLYINAQSLTLSSNGFANGAYSLDGELNVGNNQILVPSALPNLHWLTNNGVISLPNFAHFGTAAPVFITNIIAGVQGAAPMGTLTGVVNTTNGLKAMNVTIGTNVYVFENKLTNTTPNQVKIAPTLSGTMSNLIAAINIGTGKGTNYSSSTHTNVLVTAGRLSNLAFTATAVTQGTAENSVATTTTAANLSWGGATLSGGTNAVAPVTNITVQSGPYGAFVNNGTISCQGSQIFANYFQNSGFFENGQNSFTLNSISAVFVNGTVFAFFPLPPTFTNGLTGNISITANSLVVSNTFLEAGGGMTLQVTNLLTDTGVSSANLWILECGSLSGLTLPIKPVSGDILGTSILLRTPSPNKVVKNVWAAQDFGVSNSGFTNNVAIGQLVLDIPSSGSSFSLTGVGNDSAMYVDQLVLNDYASTANSVGTNIPTILINTNLTIYYADAIASTTVNGGPFTDVSAQLDHYNTNRLRWVKSYSGFFSSTNIIVPKSKTSVLPRVSAAVGEGGQFKMTVLSAAPSVIIQASTNLVDWTNISTNTPPFVFTDSITAGIPYRYYRAIMQ